MSFETNQLLASGDSVSVMTQSSAQVIRVEIVDQQGEVTAYTTLNVAELDALIHVLRAARTLADIYTLGGV